MEPSDVTVVVVTWNALPWLEQALESVRGRDVVVVDHGSTDGTLELVRTRYPEVRIVEQENKGMGGGNNAGMRVAEGRYFFLLNSDAWVVGDGLDALIAYADAHPEAAVVGPRLRNTDGSLQRSVRGEPTLWRLATEYLFIRKLAPRSSRLNPLYVGGFDHESEREADWLFGPALLVRRAAVDQVGVFDEDFFMFSEEVDWMTRFRRAGWKVLFYPGAEVVHVGGATHGGRLYVENLRGHLRYAAKHHGPRAAERTRRLLLFSLRLRALVLRREAYREGIRFLSSGDADTLLS
ncbi:MAG TPA: glycosyltransferase family 2 protein [Gaiellaceae bacterium]|nr:glycosyltransferase family 2 protein [Gaiellaceae bacterium]